MIKFAKTSILVLIFLATCNCNQQKNQEDIDSLFWGFVAHPENQISYIKFPLKIIENGVQKSITKSEWKPFESNSELVRIFCDETHCKEFKDNAKIENVSIIYIYPEKNISSQFYFVNEKGKWRLSEMKTLQGKFNDEGNFFGFINIFMKNESFKKERIKYPIEYSYIDVEGDYTEQTGLAKSYDELIEKFSLSIETSVITVFQDSGESNCNENKRIINIKVPGTSTNINLFFKRINNKWFLVKYENFSV